MNSNSLQLHSDDSPDMAAITQSFEQYFSPANQSAQGWPQEFRDRAIKKLAATGFPGSHEEDWKYTSLDTFIKRSKDYLMTGPYKGNTDSAQELIAGLPDLEDEIRIVFVNGIFDQHLSSDLTGNTAISLTPFSICDSALTDQHNFELIDQNPLIALNSAFLADGLNIRIAAGQKIESPLHVIFVEDGNPTAVQARMAIEIGENATATVLQHHLSAGQGLTNAVTRLICAEHSHLSYIRLQNDSKDSIYICNLLASLAESSCLDYVGLDFGSMLARSDINIEIAGQDATANLYGLFMANEKRHVDNHLKIDHQIKNTRSQEIFRGIMNDQARGVFNGKIIVHRGADGTDASMSNHNLLLGERAEIDTKPELEIYTDDVKCAHGSTTGRLDKNSLFYLRARGIPENIARIMLVSSFAREIIDQACIAIPAMQHHLENLIHAQLPENI